MNDLFDNLMSLDVAQAWTFLGDVLRNPTSNIVAFVLILAIITIGLLVVIAVLLLLFMGGEDEELEPPASDVDSPAAGQARQSSSLAAAAPPEAKRPRYVAALMWLAAVALIWIAGGWVTGQDDICASCHLEDSSHEARLEQTGEDPHDPVRCVSCHESPWSLAALTTAVPARAVHFAAGVAYTPLAQSYGNPVANSTCAHCHGTVLATTHENTERGIKVSHAEPLESNARCLDCHVPQPDTGVIDGRTVGMSACIRCHDSRTASAECEYCHTKDVAYAMQARGTIKPVSHITTLDCGGCHDQTTCDACHGMRMPHSQLFMGFGHARPAVEDIWYNGGRLCARCHSDDRRSCLNCHGGTFPAHPLSYMPTGHQSADPYNNSCNTACHVGLRWDVNRNFCGNCHERYSKIEGTLGR